MMGSSDDSWRPRCGDCGSTSMRARTTTRERVEPVVCYYECTACGRAWDGSEAPEPVRALDANGIADVVAGVLRAAGVQVHTRLDEDETDEQFAARIRASMTDPRKDH